MKNKTANIILIFLGYLVPLDLLHLYRNIPGGEYKMQNPLLWIILLASILLIWLNARSLRGTKEGRGWYWLLIVLGSVAGIYSGIIILLVYSFR